MLCPYNVHIYYNRACLWVSHNALFWNFQTHLVNHSIYNFDCVFLEIPAKYCFVGMLLTCPIISYHKRHSLAFICSCKKYGQILLVVANFSLDYDCNSLILSPEDLYIFRCDFSTRKLDNLKNYWRNPGLFCLHGNNSWKCDTAIHECMYSDFTLWYFSGFVNLHVPCFIITGCFHRNTNNLFNFKGGNSNLHCLSATQW